jgi:hypothetical protein
MSSSVTIRTTVLPGHRIEVASPDLPEGQDVEVSVSPVSEPQRDLAARFLDLANRWSRETAGQSSVSRMVMHPAYQEVIGLGPSAIPLILEAMQKQPAHWFWALRAITGEDPVPLAHRGSVRAMTQDWLAWGRDRGLVR